MYLIAGCGLTGCVIARKIADELKEEVLIIDRRPHIAGNIYDYKDENGIYLHKYGPHAFHTNNKLVWDFLSRFTEWEVYFHRVLAMIDGMEAPLPFNLNSINRLFPKGLVQRLEDRLIEHFGYNVKVPILKLKDTDDPDLKFLADYVYEKVYYGYTLKQWGLKPEELDPSVTARVPVCISRDDRYFHDKYQGIPKHGYTELIARMIENPLIKIELNTDFKDVDSKGRFKKIIYTGPVDGYFGFRHGSLPYRSLRFVFDEKDREFYQPSAQVNYPDNFDFTRITEFKHFLNTVSDRTAIAYEYPEQYDVKTNEPYYPIPNERNDALYGLYKKNADAEKGVVFAGRLGEYKYLNMDQAAARAIEVYEQRINE